MNYFIQAYDTANTLYFVNINEIKFLRPCANGEGAWLVLKGDTERSLYVVTETYAKMRNLFINDL